MQHYLSELRNGLIAVHKNYELKERLIRQTKYLKYGFADLSAPEKNKRQIEILDCEIRIANIRKRMIGEINESTNMLLHSLLENI